MPRNSSGTYTLPSSAFVPNTTISSAAVNANFSDIANALTQSLATTGVSPMVGQFLAASGNVSSPGYCFASDKTTGFYLAGTHQIGWAANGSQAATFNSDSSVSWNGNQTVTGTMTLGSTVTFNGTSFAFAAGGTAAFWSALGPNSAVEAAFDGGGSVIGTSNVFINLEIPFPATINRWTIVADQNTTSTIQVYKVNAALPNSGNTITGGSPPSISGSTYATSTSLGSWSTACAARDIIQFNVSANNNAIKLLISLTVTRTG